jgi:molybdopterin converting factor small subunit
MGPSMGNSATILLFATARTAVGASRLQWPVGPTGVTARALVRALSVEYPKLGPALRTSRFVLNGEYLSGLTARVRPGDEFAVHPPYGGG